MRELLRERLRSFNRIDDAGRHAMADAAHFERLERDLASRALADDILKYCEIRTATAGNEIRTVYSCVVLTPSEAAQLDKYIAHLERRDPFGWVR